MKTNSKKFRLLKDKELRNKFLSDQIKIGLRYQLRSLRDSQGLTQKALADLIGTKQSVISRLERTPERVSIPTLLDIAEALDVGVVVRFEAIDTVLEWYSNPTQKKSTPRKSEDILMEIEEREALKQKQSGDFSQTGQPKLIDIDDTVRRIAYKNKTALLKNLIFNVDFEKNLISRQGRKYISAKKAVATEQQRVKQNYINPIQDYTGIPTLN